MRSFTSVSDALEEYVAPFDDDNGDWAEILRRADEKPPRRRRRLGARAGLAGAAVGAAVFALLVWPLAGDNPGVLDRALAAVGEGPVLHVVLEDDWAGTLVDLDTGERRELHGQREVWYDPARGLHSISSFGGVVQDDVLFGPRELQPHQVTTFAALRDYRDALRSGRARDLGPGEAHGEPVYWIRVDAQWLPDADDGKLHEWAHDVGISRTTFEPVATRETRDGNPGPDTGARILRLETLQAGAGDFSVRPSRDGIVHREGRDAITLESAADALGRSPLWLGRDYAGLPLAQVFRTTTAEGRHARTELSGSAAAGMKACRDYVEQNGRRGGPACDRIQRAGHSLLMRGGKLYALGPVEWGESHTGVVLFYGTLADDASTPLWDHPYIGLTETTRVSGVHAPAGYVPPGGSVLLTGGRLGLLMIDGVYISIAASSEELVLSAARALEPMS